MQQRGQQAVTVKKYSNRRLYDTTDSRYITLDELAEKIRAGKDVRVVDAKTNEDLTQTTLAQIILESRRAARLLPVPLLTQLIRMGDDALAEFFGKYMSTALEMYFHAKQGAQALAPFNPFATLPFNATSALARLLSAVPGWGDPNAAGPGWGPGMAGGFKDPATNGAPPWQENAPAPAPEPPPPAEERAEPQEDIASLRKEIEALKEAILRRGN